MTQDKNQVMKKEQIMKKEMDNNTLCTRWLNELNHEVHRVIKERSLVHCYCITSLLIEYISLLLIRMKYNPGGRSPV
jgi:hypothetical protein